MKTIQILSLLNQRLVLILTFIVGGIIFSAGILNAQENNEILAPDQNPNFRKSLEKYMETKDSYLKLSGTTVQETYKAIDDMEAKKEQKALRKERRQERRMARINRPRNYHPSPYYWGYNYHNRPFNNFDYGWNGYHSGKY